MGEWQGSEPMRGGEPPQRNARLFVGIMLALVVVGFALSGSDSDEPTAVGPVDDASARVACRNWESLVRDAARGVMTDAEIRAELQEIESSARVSENETVRLQSERALAALTQGDTEGFDLAAERLTNACARIDY